MRSRSSFLLALVVVVIAPGLARAVDSPQVVFTTLTSIGGYDNGSAIRISGASAFPQGYEAYACQFIPSASGRLYSVDLGVGYSSWAGPDSQIDVRLSLATGGLPLSTPALTSGTLTTATLFGGGGLTTFTPANQVDLLAGTAYWLTLLPHSDTTASVWCLPSSPINGTFGYTSFGGGAWFMADGAGMKAFQVSVIPEPGAVSLGVVAVGLFLGGRRRRVCFCGKRGRNLQRLDAPGR
jgi:hypothetical protein